MKLLPLLLVSVFCLLAAEAKNCKSYWSAASCATYKAEGRCTNSSESFQLRKLKCAKECGLCGKAARPCVDLRNDCQGAAAKRACAKEDPMLAEYWCAKSCGFCNHPN